ncbi:MAG: hypothetical protein WCF60_07015, partial [Anaerobacillus sp.]
SNLNTVFVFEFDGEVTEGLPTAAGHEKWRRAFRNVDIGTLDLPSKKKRLQLTKLKSFFLFHTRVILLS